ncbi:hypothetical protein [Halococcus sp. PRR34]|uniref:hypothetical protein n=1 Tax=Halococcus sp. PRR34 TaxID=3020830 RepID=UPI002362367F|nr:hypothetical protein [Halococcus sp. PRR34]
MVKLLYNLSIPTDALVSTGSQITTQIAEQGSVGESGEGGSAIPVANQPGEESLQGAFRDPQLGGVMGQEVEELFDAGGIEYVPLTALEDGEDGPNAGYYALKDTSRNRVHPNTDAIQAFDGTATKAGTAKTHVRAIHAAPTDVDTIGTSDYTNADPPARTELVCLPPDARRPRWFDPVAGVVENAEPLNEWQYPPARGEFVNFRWYDLADASFYDPAADAPALPTLVYEYDYAREYRMDVKVWDTAPDYVGSAKVVEGDLEPGSTVGGPDAIVGEAVIGESVREDNAKVSTAWQHVFRTGHDFSTDGDCVIDNGVLRLWLDDDVGQIAAQRSSGHFDAWAGQGLRGSDWALRDFDLSHIGLARVDAQITWQHGKTGEQYRTDLSLPRGYDKAIWTVPQNEDSGAPADLRQKLAPVAKWGGVSVRTPHASAGLVAREDLRK